MTKEYSDNVSISGDDLKDEKLDLGQVTSTEERHHQETLRMTTLSSVKTDSPFYNQNLTYTQEEEKKIIRIIDMRLFRTFLTPCRVKCIDVRSVSCHTVVYVRSEHVRRQVSCG